MTAPKPALFERYPHLADRVGWVSLGCTRTPLQTLELETPTGRRTVLVKRDDLTAEPYGGNKVRKLEFILARAQGRGAARLITAGAAGSHHALATTLYGRQLGFAVSLVLFPQKLTDHVRDVLLMDHGAGATLHFVRRMELVPLGVAAARVRHFREKPFVVAPGGSDPFGTLGYVSAGLEIADQLTNAGQHPSAAYVAAGTLGSAAGLALGFALAGLSLRVRATRITSRLVANERALRHIVDDTAGLLRAAGVDVPPLEEVLSLLELRDGQIGAGYGRETAAGKNATRVFGGVGLRLDPTYTAKAAADLLAEPADDAAPPLFIHTLSASEPLHLAHAADAARLPSRFRAYLGVESALPRDRPTG